MSTACSRCWSENGSSNGFGDRGAKPARPLALPGLHFMTVRGTAVTRFALMEATEAEIAYITGLSLRGVRAILDSHYLSRDPALGDSAIMKLERRTKTPD